MSEPWLTVIGIGDNGLDSLSGDALGCLIRSKVIVVSERLVQVTDRIYDIRRTSIPPSVPSGHLPLKGEMSAQPTERGEEAVTILKWSDGYQSTLATILERRGTPVTILATGDPMHFGIGSTLLKHVAPEEMRVFPSPSAFSLAASRLGWPLQNVAQISLHGRAIETINRHLFPASRILALTSDASTILSVAGLLVARGFGSSILTVLEHMGGAQERIVSMTAHAIAHETPAFDDFNTLALDCVSDADAVIWSPVTGLPDHAFQHDGQMTKREVRAATLSALQPLPGKLLWDVGAGCGSVSIEWMRAASLCSAIAIEPKPERLAMIAINAKNLGVPDLTIIEGEAPAVLNGLSQPDAIFIGGGITGEGVFEACWAALKPGGRLVANAVTLEGEARLIGLRAVHGGEMTRISVSHATPVGRYCGWKSLMPVTLWSVVKPRAAEEVTP
jgi:precorrin-6Y C5,15-methyltransferase (decarboxylating)